MLHIIGNGFVVCTRSRKNLKTERKGLLSWEWSQQLELAYFDLMGSRKDPELHTKMFCEGMHGSDALMACLVNERRKSIGRRGRFDLSVTESPTFSL